MSSVLYHMMVLLRRSVLYTLADPSCWVVKSFLLYKLDGGFTEAVLARPKCETFCAVSDGGLTEMVRVISPVWILTILVLLLLLLLVAV